MKGGDSLFGGCRRFLVQIKMLKVRMSRRRIANPPRAPARIVLILVRVSVDPIVEFCAASDADGTIVRGTVVVTRINPVLETV